MKTTILLCLLALTAPVYADCMRPSDDVKIPNGASATRDDMIAAQKSIKAYDAAVKAYSDCLQQEQDTRVAAGEDRAKIAPEYAKLQNNEVDKLQKVADRFNVELRAFKAKNTGS